MWVLADDSAACSPNQWARRAVDLWARVARRMPGAHGVIVAETNFGGDMVLDTLRGHVEDRPDLAVRPKVVKTVSSRGKRIRAEPVAGLYEQGRVEHVGPLDELEAEMCGWDAADPGAASPNRLDAMVFAANQLMFGERPATVKQQRLHGV